MGFGAGARDICGLGFEKRWRSLRSVCGGRGLSGLLLRNGRSSVGCCRGGRLRSSRSSRSFSGFGVSFFAKGAQKGVLLAAFFTGRGAEVTVDFRLLAARSVSFFGATVWTLGLAARLGAFFGASATGGVGARAACLGVVALRGVAAFLGESAFMALGALLAAFLGAAFFGTAGSLAAAGCRFGRFSSMIVW